MNKADALAAVKEIFEDPDRDHADALSDLEEIAAFCNEKLGSTTRDSIRLSEAASVVSVVFATLREIEPVLWRRIIDNSVERNKTTSSDRKDTLNICRLAVADSNLTLSEDRGS